MPLKWNEIFFVESSFTNIISSERKWQTFPLGSETYHDKFNWCYLCKLGTKFLGYFPILRLQRIDFSCNKYFFFGFQRLMQFHLSDDIKKGINTLQSRIHCTFSVYYLHNIQFHVFFQCNSFLSFLRLFCRMRNRS